MVLLILLDVLHVFDKCLLVDHTRVLAVFSNADIPQTEFDEALVDEIHGGAIFQGNGCLYV